MSKHEWTHARPDVRKVTLMVVAYTTGCGNEGCVARGVTELHDDDGLVAWIDPLEADSRMLRAPNSDSKGRP